MKRSKFSLSYTKLLSCDMGELIPCGLMEVLPGDSVQHSTAALVRAAALLAPVMHPVHVRIHHWFVPNRLLWTNWERFITGGMDGMDASVFPTITFASGVGVGTLGDYLGVPTGVNGITVSALPFRGYNEIWNQWYRDEDLQTALVSSTADGNDTTSNIALQNCAWEKDYYTSARPWEQKGPTVTVPLGSTAPVIRDPAGDFAPRFRSSGADSTTRTMVGTSGSASNTWSGGNLTATGSMIWAAGSGNAGPNLVTDLSGASAVTVNVLRQALAVQRFEEARARYGSRYVEYLRFLGVRSSDARLQRPEYLGGGRQTIQFSEVLQTAEGTNAVGTLRGHGISAMRSNRYRRFFEEHGYVYTFISVKPKTIYANGLFRHWNRRTKLDFWQRELQHIGQQAVLRKEVYAGAASPDATFGYQDRYDEYRRMESSIAGEFRSSTLDFWHMARIFASEPSLNASFVSCVPTERSFAVPSQDVIYIHAKHTIGARRLVAQSGHSFIF